MRAREVLQEDYNQSLQSDLDNLLVGAKANGATEVDTKAVVDQMYAMGYAVDVNSIVSLLSQNPVVTSATPETIMLSQPNAGTGSEDDSASHVKDMARKANSLGT